LLVIGLPEKADRGVECLGELVTRHWTLSQAREDGVGEGQGPDSFQVGMVAKY
jgi:hypothetical protein